MADWHESLGSFVVLPRGAVSRWAGGEEGLRACEEARLRRTADDVTVLEPLGVLDLGDGAQALVLGDEHSPTTYVSEERVFVRWLWADASPTDDDLLDLALWSLPTAIWEEGPLFDVPGTPAMFDSQTCGTEAGVPADAPMIDAAPGRYRVDTCELEPDCEVRIELHRLAPVSLRG